MYLRFISEKDRAEAFITYIKPQHCLKGLREPITFDSVVNGFILWECKASLEVRRHRLHVALRLGEVNIFGSKWANYVENLAGGLEPLLVGSLHVVDINHRGTKPESQDED